MGFGVLFFHAFMCSHVATEPLFTAGLWATPVESAVSRKHLALPLPSPLLQPCLVSHLDYSQAEQALG